ncbi:MAG: hypothetical protein R2762_17595 [Bryobacteraceae bacterium]
MPKRDGFLAIAIIAVVTALNHAWTLSPLHYYFADDWAWLNYGAFVPYGQLTDWLPQQPYNDRPAGAVFIKVLYQWLGLNPAAHHGILLGLHVWNAVLVFLLARRWTNGTAAAFGAAVVFGNWAASITAFTWLAAIFDLLGCTLVLGSVLAYMHPGWRWRVASAVLFFIALRTKEFAIVVPAILALWEVSRNGWGDALPILRRLALSIAIAAIVGAKYLWLVTHGDVLKPGDVYTPVFTMAVFADCLGQYLRLLLGLASGGAGAIAAVLMAAAVAAARRQWTVVVALSSFVLLLLPVLFLPKRISPLYLYAPSAFFWIGAAGWVAGMVGGRWGGVAAAVLGVGMTGWQAAGPVRRLEREVLDRSAPFAQSASDLRRLYPTLPRGNRFFIEGLPDYLNLFDYGPCHAVRVMYRDDSQRCTIYLPPGELMAAYEAAAEPKQYLIYDGGKLKQRAVAPMPLLPPAKGEVLAHRAYGEGGAAEGVFSGAPASSASGYTIEIIASLDEQGAPLGTLLTNQDPGARRGVTIQRPLSGAGVLECVVGEGGEWHAIGQWTPPAGQDVYLALTYAGGQWAGYLDGREVFRAQGGEGASGLPWMLGNLEPGGPRPAGARIREARLRRGAASAEELAAAAWAVARPH